MNINYKRLFNLNIGHDYFTDGYDRFAHLSPTAATEKLLRNGKMLFKSIPHGITVLYRATDDEVTPFVPLGNDQHFIFILKTNRIKGLLNITNFDESPARPYQTNNVLYFSNNPANASVNAANPEIITHLLIDSVRAKLFTYVFSLSGSPSTVLFRLLDHQGNPVSVGYAPDGTPLPTTLTLALNTSGGYSQQVDMRDKPDGKYTLTILNSAGTTTLKQEVIYLADALATQNILGIVDIVYDTANGHLYGDTEEYLLQFHRAEATWKYYIVNKSANIDFASDSLQIADTGTPNGTPYIVNDFIRSNAGIQLVADTPGTAGNSITLEYSGGSVHPAVVLSGKTLSGGSSGVAATGFITLINNTLSGYTISINGVDFTEGTQFNKGANPGLTATAIVAAINANGADGVSASLSGFDMRINDFPSLVFSSSQQIPFFEKTKANIQLQKTSDSQPIITNLPNPAHNGNTKLFAGEPETEVFVFI